MEGAEVKEVSSGGRLEFDAANVGRRALRSNVAVLV